MKVSHGDSVLVIAGKDKGKKGKVLRVLPDAARVIVADVNMVTKHIKKTAQNAGQKVRYEASIHVSNVMVLDPKTGKPTRVGYKMNAKTGRKERMAKVSGTVIGRMKMVERGPKEKQENVTRKAPSSTTGKKSPFWKKIGFGADAGVRASDSSSKTETGAAPASTIAHSRSGSRGS